MTEREAACGRSGGGGIVIVLSLATLTLGPNEMEFLNWLYGLVV